MRASSRAVSSAVLLAFAALALPGCPAFTNMVLKPLGISRSPELDLSGPMPQDFELRVHVTDQKVPPADYVLIFRRTGKCDYYVTVREPKRYQNNGSFEILEGQVAALYDTAREIKYDKMDERTPSDGEGKDRALGVQAYAVRGDGLEREVQAHSAAVPGLEKLRTLALSYLPAKALADTGPGAPVAGKSQLIVGDTKTKRFYPADDKRLQDVPADRRQPFANWQDAVNFDYSPAPGFAPWDRKE